MKKNGSSPLDRIVFISIPEETAQKAEGVPLDSAKLLPVEIPPGEDSWIIQNLSWEMIIAAMLKIFAWNPHHEDIVYYRSLINAMEPDIEHRMTHTGVRSAEKKEFSVAEEIFRALVHFNDKNVNNFINLALVLEEQSSLYEELGNYELSERYLTDTFNTYLDALTLHTSSADLYFNFGNFYIKRKNLKKARKMFQKFVSLEPPGKRREFALEILQKIPENPKEELLLLEAYDLIQMKQEERGIEKIKTFLDDHPDIWNAWFLLGWAYRRKEEYAAGKDAFIQSIKLNNTHVDSYNELAICLMEMNELALCKQYLKKALQLESENTKTIINFGILALKEHNTEEAAGFFRIVLEYDPDNTTAEKYLHHLTQKK